MRQLCLSNSIDTGVFDHSGPEVVGVRLTQILYGYRITKFPLFVLLFLTVMESKSDSVNDVTPTAPQGRKGGRLAAWAAALF